MAEKRDILWRFLGDAKGLDRASRDAQKDLGGIEKKGAGAADAIGGIGRAMAAAGLAIGAKEVGEFAFEAFRMSEKAEVAAESLEKVLGPAADDLRAKLEDQRGTMGLNMLEFDQMASTLGLLITGQGVAADDAAVLIEELITKGGDLAAFRGDLDLTSEAIGAVTAAIRGEFDPLEQWGVKLSAAGLTAAKEKRASIDPLFASLSDGEQTIRIITDLINEQAAPAMGALGEAASTTEGKINDMNTKLDDLKIQLGDELEPVFSILIERALTLTESLGTLADDSESQAEKTKAAWVLALDLVLDRFGLVRGAIQGVKDKWNDLVSTVKNAPSNLADAIGGAIGGIPRNLPRFPGFQSGGIVPGPKGQPRMIMAHGGERVSGMGDTGGGGGVVINFNGVVGDPDAVAAQIADLFTRYQQTNAIPIDGLSSF